MVRIQKIAVRLFFYTYPRILETTIQVYFSLFPSSGRSSTKLNKIMSRDGFYFQRYSLHILLLFLFLASKPFKVKMCLFMSKYQAKTVKVYALSLSLLQTSILHTITTTHNNSQLMYNVTPMFPASRLWS